jgi:phage-Barnase-EndoU-ColicinE5/D-RelE like nuclease2
MQEYRMHHMLNIVEDWKKDYHTKGDDIVFQNKKTLTNVFFNNNSFHKISSHNKGFELLPETIMQPDQIWSHWEDPDKQQIVLRNYIKGQYVVFTRQGIVTDAYLVAKSSIARFQKGVILN